MPGNGVVTLNEGARDAPKAWSSIFHNGLITESTEAADGPKDWHSMFGSTLLTKAGPKPTADVVANKKLIGLYFSASWCGPCKRFTPELVNLYEARKKTAADFYVFFNSEFERIGDVFSNSTF